MKKPIFTLFSALLAYVLLPFTAVADDDLGEPIITFHTTIYEENGAENDFSILLGGSSTGVGQYIDIDCGSGTFEAQLEEANYDSSSDSSSGTFVSCRVTEEGIVKIYADDAKWIDWFNASGCYIDWIKFNGTSEIFYLDLSHNALTSLDLSGMPNISALYLTDNPFSETPLVVGKQPYLTILEINYIGALDKSFNLSDYPEMLSFDAWAAGGLDKLDPTGCPNLQKISIDGTNVESIDVSKNPQLLILNISDTRITSLDLSNNTLLRELYASHESSVNEQYKLSNIDVSNCPDLYYFFCSGNDMATIDVTKNVNLGSLTARKNRLTSIDVSQNTNLFCLNISDNYFGYSNLPWPLTDDGNDRWDEYDYRQRNLSAAPSYPIGAELDYSDMVLREGSDTEAFLYSELATDPNDVYLVDQSCYSYSNGKLKLLALPTIDGEAVDSVFIRFSNTVFSASNLRTSNFAVKTADEYGKPVKAFSLTSGAYQDASVKFGVGIFGASATTPKTFYVDLGDGEMTPFTATSSDADVANVDATSKGYGLLTVYVNDGDEISALNVDRLTLYSADLSLLRSMRSLSLTNTGIYSVDLQWNRSLESLNLSHNNISYLSLAGNNQAYAKNALTDFDASYNSISTFIWTENYAIKHLNLGHNDLSELSFSGNTRIESIDLSYNKFAEMSVVDCENLTSLNVAGNQLSTITLPETNILTYLQLDNNKFSLATLPEHGSLTEANYIYAPQSPIEIAEKAPGVNLSAQDIDKNSVFTWKKANGDALISGVDYLCEGGYTWFYNTTVGNVYCEISNPAYPAFTGDNILKTTLCEAAAMPTHVAASFVTEETSTTAVLTMTATKANTSVYVDWSGKGDFYQYVLGTSYTNFKVPTYAGATVKVYTYDDTDNISVFSLRGAPLKSFDGSAMKQLICLNLGGAGLSDDAIVYPESPNLSELILESNKLTKVDLTRYPKLSYLNLSNNAISDIDLTNLGSLTEIYLGNNQLTSVSFGKNLTLWSVFVNDNELTSVDISQLPKLRQFNANYNQLTSIDFSGNPNLSVVLLNNNLFETIDLSPLNNLQMLEITGNRFKFSTLPVEEEIFATMIKANNTYTYKYSDQAELEITPVDGIVDLSSEAVVNGVATTYTWYVDELDYDSDGYIVNSELYGPDNEYGEDPEYTLEQGVTTFVTPQERVLCVLTNSGFPDLTLYTNLITTEAGVEAVSVDRVDGPTEYYNLSGIRMNAKHLAPGFYIKRVGQNATKVHIN